MASFLRKVGLVVLFLIPPLIIFVDGAFVVNDLLLAYAVSVILGDGVRYIIVKCRKRFAEKEHLSLDHVPGMPIRFNYDELKAATQNFSSKLGEGGFGSVFEGTLRTGEKIAVKQLEGVKQGMKEFLTEVMTIGSIHHVNLVRLIGFCAEKSHKLLVYEYMRNGSLEKWIYHRNQGSSTLDWQTLRKIIIDIAKGVAYLHEECNPKIIHLDIKPQNILLDTNFTVKVSDFGLAKQIDRDESHVITIMRGTRGYLAPEWLSNRKITEKVDVYSFGVLVLEIMSGRKNLDGSEEYLLDLVRSKAEAGQLFDIVDKRRVDMQQHREEAVEMIKIAIWCLHDDLARRPSMSMVVRILEGSIEIDNISEYGFLTLIHVPSPSVIEVVGSAPPSASVLSGPR